MCYEASSSIALRGENEESHMAEKYVDDKNGQKIEKFIEDRRLWFT